MKSKKKKSDQISRLITKMSVVKEMRLLALQGRQPFEILRSIVDSLSLEPDCRVEAVFYFADAFNLGLAQCAAISIWDGFEQGRLGEESINQYMAPVISEWVLSQTNLR